MADGPEDIDIDDAGGGPEEGPILSPEELDIADDEHVTQLDEGRYVVSPEARPEETKSQQGPPTERGQAESQSSGESEPTPDTGDRSPSRGISERAPREQSQGADLSREEVHRWLRESFAGGGSRYGFDVTATFDGSISQRRMASNDVVTIFESLILWYAQQIDSDTPVEEILGILLMEANVPVRYPPESLKNLVKSTGLGPDDTIADLLAAVDEDDGVEL
jgi:hypothetical protein